MPVTRSKSQLLRSSTDNTVDGASLVSVEKEVEDVCEGPEGLRRNMLPIFLENRDNRDKVERLLEDDLGET